MFTSFPFPFLCHGLLGLIWMRMRTPPFLFLALVLLPSLPASASQFVNLGNWGENHEATHHPAPFLRFEVNSNIKGRLDDRDAGPGLS